MTDPVAANDAATDTDTIAAAGRRRARRDPVRQRRRTVTGSDLQIDCGSTCAHAYAGGRADADRESGDGVRVHRVAGACTGTSPCQPFIDGDTHVSATFAPDTIGVRTLVARRQRPVRRADRRAARHPLSVRADRAVADRFRARQRRAAHSDPAAVLGYLADVRPSWLTSMATALPTRFTDGLLIVRYLFNRRGTALTEGAIGAGATRGTAPAIELYIQGLRP
jgi:hypothetical protein